MRFRPLIFAFTLSIAARAEAQQHPNLSGTWAAGAADQTKAPLPAIGKIGTGVKGAATASIRQTPDTLTWTGNGLTYKYALDGSETVNCSRSQGTCFPNRCSAHWNADILYLNCRSASESGREIIETERVWIDSDGNLQLSGRVATQGVTTSMRSTFARQTTIIFDDVSGAARQQ